VKQILPVLGLAAIFWSCSDLSVDPKFSVVTSLRPVFELASPIPANEAQFADNRLWFDTASIAAELRGAGKAGAEVDSSYVRRIAFHSDDASWPLSNISTAAILLGGDTIAKADIPDVTGADVVFAKSDLRPPAFDLPVQPGDSVSFRLVYWLRTATTDTHSLAADITIATEARAKFQ
jgi:hypothetical protein